VRLTVGALDSKPTENSDNNGFVDTGASAGRESRFLGEWESGSWDLAANRPWV